jgi:hypothetical protein
MSVRAYRTRAAVLFRARHHVLFASVARVVRTRCRAPCRVPFAHIARCPRAKSFVSARRAHRVCASCVVNSSRLETLILIKLLA